MFQQMRSSKRGRGREGEEEVELGRAKLRFK